MLGTVVGGIVEMSVGVKVGAVLGTGVGLPLENVGN